MPAAKKATETSEPSRDIIGELFDKAYEIREEQEALNTRRTGVRNSLRALRDGGVLSEEQAVEVEELYPTVERKRKNGEDGEDVENAGEATADADTGSN